MAVLTLALGFGANTAVFTVVNGVCSVLLPFPDPGRLFLISYQSRVAGLKSWVYTTEIISSTRGTIERSGRSRLSMKTPQPLLEQESRARAEDDVTSSFFPCSM